ncbi:hypothetical protein [Dyadobacter luticola]|uniref:Uncharacterized protein n=1 Tax=Dyadobacter luticola TaxID=1979387 RepID=A0A5R9KR70_9BACT|nr:hypothetical protein [Dyadobacter luticola]TLU98733.1 hypothetical protein FEN17_19200 [Dyadobacter luticola]
MGNQVAFYQILFQNETLFQVEERVLSEVKREVEAKVQPVQTPVTPAALPKTPAITPPVAAAPQPAKPVAQEYFPALKHQILILIDEPKNKEMPDSEALLLDNILKAVGHSTSHADILNFSFLPGQNARSVLSEKKTNFFITFGVPLIKLNLDLLLAPYTPKSIEGIWFLLADPLAVIEADRDLKKKLWQALKKMFEMS